jgi:hypothetical protein
LARANKVGFGNKAIGPLACQQLLLAGLGITRVLAHAYVAFSNSLLERKLENRWPESEATIPPVYSGAREPACWLFG